MKIKPLFLVFFILLLTMLSTLSTLSTGCSQIFNNAINIKKKGNEITVSVGKDTLSMMKGSRCTNSFIVISGDLVPSKIITGWLCVIPLDTYRRLRTRYGNIFQCSNPGAKDAKKSSSMFALIPVNNKIKNKIIKIIKVAKKLNRPIIKIKAIKVKVLEETYKVNDIKAPFPFQCNDFQTCYLVGDIELIR